MKKRGDESGEEKREHGRRGTARARDPDGLLELLLHATFVGGSCVCGRVALVGPM